MASQSVDDPADGLSQGTQFQSTNGRRRQHGSEEEVVIGRHNGDVVVSRIQLLEHGNTAPAGAQDDELGLVFLLEHAVTILIVDQDSSYGQVLWTSPLGGES